MTSKQAWGGFWLLALIWGSSFLFIRIGVEQPPPFQLVFIRTGIAALGLNAVVYLRGKRLPTDRRSLFDLLVLGIVNNWRALAIVALAVVLTRHPKSDNNETPLQYASKLHRI